MKFLLGKKIGMSQVFKDENSIPVTIIKAGPCFVTQIKTKEKDNYSGIQIGFEKLKDKKISKSKKNKPYRYLREFLTTDSESLKKIGEKIDVSIFKEGSIVKISGVSKGKGFQGVVKRHKFSGGPASHGHRHVLRTPGSIGSAYPQRVMKGKKMPGHTGNKRVTTTGLKIITIDSKNNILAIKGAIPGANGRLVEITNK